MKRFFVALFALVLASPSQATRAAAFGPAGVETGSAAIRPLQDLPRSPESAEFGSARPAGECALDSRGTTGAARGLSNGACPELPAARIAARQAQTDATARREVRLGSVAPGFPYDATAPPAGLTA